MSPAMGGGSSKRKGLDRRGTVRMGTQALVPPWLETLSGVLGQMFSSTMVYPIDIVKVVLQTSGHDEAAMAGNRPSALEVITKIWLTGGLFNGFYRGIFAEYIKESAKMFVFFITKSNLMQVCRNKESGGISYLAETAAGMVAGVATQAVLIPLSVAHVRMQAGVSTAGFFGTIMNIYRVGGVADLWSGFWPSTVLAIYPALNFLICSRVKEMWQRAKWKKIAKQHKASRLEGNGHTDTNGDDKYSIVAPGGETQWCELSLNSGEQFVVGAVAQFISTFISYPLILSRIVLQSGVGVHKSMPAVLLFLVQSGGLVGLFRGIEPMLISHTFSGAFQWLGKEKVEEVIMGVWLKEDKTD